MGQINCHCHSDPSSLSLPQSQSQQTIQIKPPLNSNQKRLKSRVNSIVSPRRIIQCHSRGGSTVQLKNLVSKNLAGKTNQNKNTKQLFQQNNACKVQLINHKKNKYKINVQKQVVKIGTICQENQNQQYRKQQGLRINVQKQYDEFQFCLKYSQIMGKISIKDNGVGLGVFKYIPKFKQFYLDSYQQNIPSYSLLDIGIGQFLIISTTQSQQQPLKYPTILLNCSIVTKQQTYISPYQNNKFSKSLPSLITQYYPSTSVNNLTIKQGESKIINNKIEIYFKKFKEETEDKNERILIRSVRNQGFYLLLNQYTELKQGDLLRFGVRLYQISKFCNQNDQLVYRITSKV